MLAPDNRQMFKVSSRLHVPNCTSKLRIRNLSSTNRNDFIGHERLKTNTRTPLMAPKQPEPNALFSNVLQHFLCVPNDESKTDFGVIMAKSNENGWHKMRRTGRTGSKMQNPCKLLSPDPILARFVLVPRKPFAIVVANERPAESKRLRARTG